MSSYLRLDLRDDGHLFGRVLGRMIIRLGVPREDDRYLGLIRLSSSRTLSLTCLLDLRYLGLD